MVRAMNRMAGAFLATIIVAASLMSAPGAYKAGGAEQAGGQASKGKEVKAEKGHIPKPDKTSELPPPQWYVAKTIADFYGNKLSPESLAAMEGDPRSISSRKWRAWGVPDGESTEIKFVIATVPDPIHTHLSLFFDRTIDAIEQGAEQEGYMFARAYMPWDNREHPESTEFEERLKQAEHEG